MKELSKPMIESLIFRRKQIFSKMKNNSIAILPGASLQYRNGDSEYPFRQNSYFYYLSGFCEPDSVLCLVKSSGTELQYILFCPAKNPLDEVWTGPKAGIIEAKTHYRADHAYEISELDSIMPKLLADKDQIYYSLGNTPTFDTKMMAWVNGLRTKNRK